MTTIKSPVSQQMVDADFRAALATDAEAALSAHGLTLTDAEREVVARLRPLLALPADALLQHLLDGGPDAGPWWWDSYPSLAGYLECPLLRCPVCLPATMGYATIEASQAGRGA